MKDPIELFKELSSIQPIKSEAWTTLYNFLKGDKVKVIFLDVDGVLNYADCWSRKENKGKGTLIWDNECIAQLNRIIKETGAKIVISSTWRLYTDHHDAVVNQMNIEGEFIGQTEDLRMMFDHAQRGDEIDAWLNKNKELNIEKFVILDDETDMRGVEDHLIQTSFGEKGLTKKLADKAIEMLCS